MSCDLVETEELGRANWVASLGSGLFCRVPEDRPSRRASLECLFAFAADAIFVHDLDGRLVDINPAACEVTGYTRAELLQMRLWDLVSHRSCQEMRRQWRRSLRGVAVTTEHIYRRRDGKLVTTEDRLTRFKCADEDLIVRVCRDISARKRLEQKLRESERSLAEAQRLTVTGSWVWDPATDLMVWSEEMFRMFGYQGATPPPGSRKLKLLLERVHVDDREAVRTAVQAILRDSRPSQFHYRIVMPDGNIKHIESIGRPIRAQAELGAKLMATARDVTEWTQVEEALRASEQLARGQAEALRQALEVLARESAPDNLLEHILCIVRRQMGAHSVTLYLHDELAGSLVFRLAIQDGRILTLADENRSAAGFDPIQYEEVRQELFRTKRPVLNHTTRRHLLVVPLLAGGRVLGATSIQRDLQQPFRPEEIALAQALSHQVTLAIELIRLAEQKRQAAVLEERNRMARDIHDTLAQGFTGILVQLGVAEEALGDGQSAEVAKHLARALALARQSLLEARRSVRALRPQALEEGSLADAFEGLLKQMTAGTELRAQFCLQGEPYPLRSHCEENLLHIGQEGLTNTLKHAQASRFHLRLAYRERQVRLELIDNGRGFAPTGMEPGSGLRGIKERVDQMGGQLTVESATGKGTRIRVVVPGRELDALPGI